MSLTIERLRSRILSPEPLPAAQCEQWLMALPDADGEILSAGLAQPDEWLLVRHLRVGLQWPRDAAAAEIGWQWQQALRSALEHAIAHPDSDEVVRYANGRAALADLLYRSALGDTARQWAWRQMRLIPRQDLQPAEALQHGLRALLEQPELVWPVLQAILAGEQTTASLTALLRALPAADWLALLHASPRSSGYAHCLSSPPAESDAEVAAAAIQAAAADLQRHANATAQTLLAWIATRSLFAARHVDVLVVLLAALAWPSQGTSSTLSQARLGAVRALLQRSAHGAPPLRGLRDEIGVPAPPLQRHGESLPPLPSQPQDSEWIYTRWAGALFWLARLPAGGLLAWQAAQDQVSLPMLLRALGQALGVPAGDAAMRALCGGETPWEEPLEAASQKASEQVAHWSAWLDDAAPELPVPRLPTVCLRDGRLRFEAGWVELHLPLDSVDTSVRRLGLDLDPGWLPWLGCVVRILYD